MLFKKTLTVAVVLFSIVTDEVGASLAKLPDPALEPGRPPLMNAVRSLQELTLVNLHTNQALYAELERLDSRCDALDLAAAGYSIEGRPLYRAAIGDGTRTLMVITQQHGDEPLGTEAALRFLSLLCGESDFAHALLNEITVVVMPRVNPDGWERWQQRLAGREDTLDPRRNSADKDLNRSYDPEDRLNEALLPEAMAVLGVVEEYRPDLLLDYHQQSNYLGDDGELETLSVRWATSSDVESNVTDVGQQAAVALAKGLDHLEHAEVSLYPGSDNPATGRNGLALRGTPTLLVEQRGLQEMSRLAKEGPRRMQYGELASAITFEGLLSMLVLAQSLAEGDLSGIDPAMALQITERGEAVGYTDVYANSDSLSREADAEESE